MKRLPQRYQVRQSGSEWIAYDAVLKQEITRFDKSQVIHEIVNRKNREYEQQINQEVECKMQGVKA